MENMIGKEVVADCGVMNPEMSGKIVGEESSELFGEFWVIEWATGSVEKVYKHSVKPFGQRNGIGVYYL